MQPRSAVLKPITYLLLIASGMLATGRALAEELSAADLAWIEKCIDDRKMEQQDPAKLRQYCTCMQGIVEDNEPFTPAELEHSYPPAHAMCMEEAGLLRP
ncbi:MAG: hypothetical protein ACM3MH_03060 [Actinomycetota bacterium]